MKVLFSSLIFLFTFLCSFTFSTHSEEICSEEMLPVTTHIKICDYDHALGSLNECGNSYMSMSIIDDNNCTAEGRISIRAVNLIANPVQSTAYQLPSNMPDIYYEYTIPGFAPVTYGPANDFFFYRGESVNMQSGGTTPLFEYTATIYVDAENFCMNDGFMRIPIVVRLVDVNGNFYDVDNYAGISEPFSCEVFEETCDVCAGSVCTGGPDPEYNIMGCGPCNGGGCSGKRSNDLEREGASISLEAQPNPFTDFVKFNFSTIKSAEYNFVILGAKGDIIYSNNSLALEGDNRLRVNTESFPSGIYFCKLEIDGKTYTSKIVKNN